MYRWQGRASSLGAPEVSRVIYRASKWSVFQAAWLDLESPWKHNSGCVCERFSKENAQEWVWGSILNGKMEVNTTPALVSLCILTADAACAAVSFPAMMLVPQEWTVVSRCEPPQKNLCSTLLLPLGISLQWWERLGEMTTDSHSLKWLAAFLWRVEREGEKGQGEQGITVLLKQVLGGLARRGLGNVSAKWRILEEDSMNLWTGEKWLFLNCWISKLCHFPKNKGKKTKNRFTGKN